MLKNLLIALALVALCALPPAFAEDFAEKPPKAMLEDISSQRLVWDKKCNFRGRIAVECMIYANPVTNTAYLLLYSPSPDLDITDVISIKDGVETILWSRGST